MDRGKQRIGITSTQFGEKKSTCNMATTDVTEVHLDPPTFTLDESNSDLELWAFRLPVALPLSALKDVTLSTDGTTIFSFNDQEYRIQSADLEEMESFRVLIPREEKNNESSTKDSDDDDDDDDDEEEKEAKKKGTLRPCRLGFTKHFQVLANTPAMTESQVAPREGPAPQDKMRRAYAPIAQRSGLKRRWMPVGAHQIATTVKEEHAPSKVKIEKESQVPTEAESQPPSKRIKRTEDASDASDSSSDDDKHLPRAERKARKAEKKAAKKAKKEAKKAKKAAKKVKKEKD
jgi:hypothetical protein